jgi:hypothetical protein
VASLRALSPPQSRNRLSSVGVASFAISSLVFLRFQLHLLPFFCLRSAISFFSSLVFRLFFLFGGHRAASLSEEGF